MKIAVNGALVGIWRHEMTTNHMSKRSQLKVILASLANLLVLSYIVYLAGYHFLFFVFFFIPVSLCGWYLGRLSVVCMAVLTGVAWCVVDITLRPSISGRGLSLCQQPDLLPGLCEHRSARAKPAAEPAQATGGAAGTGESAR